MPTLRLHLKSLMANPVAYVAARRQFRHHQGVARWATPESLQDGWDARTALIAGMIAPHSSVLEFGAGNERLPQFLPEGCTYQPADIVARSPRTLVCDLNQSFPPLDRVWDVIAFSGVLEYIHDLPALLAWVRAHSRACVLSYAATDGLECMTTRLTSGWVNHFSRAAFEQMLAEANFACVQQQAWHEQNIYSVF